MQDSANQFLPKQMFCNSFRWRWLVFGWAKGRIRLVVPVVVSGGGGVVGDITPHFCIVVAVMSGTWNHSLNTGDGREREIKGTQEPVACSLPFRELLESLLVGVRVLSHGHPSCEHPGCSTGSRGAESGPGGSSSDTDKRHSGGGGGWKGEHGAEMDRGRGELEAGKCGVVTKLKLGPRVALRGILLCWTKASQIGRRQF